LRLFLESGSAMIVTANASLSFTARLLLIEDS